MKCAFAGNVSESSEDTVLSTPLNLSTKDVSPSTPDSSSSPLIFDFKKEKFLFPVKREASQSPVDSVSDQTEPSVKTSPGHVTSSLLSPLAGHHRIWSPLVSSETDSKRIWSPAVSCEKENSNNNNTSKVVVEVRCGGCGDVTSQFRPDTSSRCHNCSHSNTAPRPERIFKV